MGLAKQLGPIFERKVLATRLIVVAGAELAAQCSDEQSWARGLAGPGLMLRKLVPDGLFTVRSSDPVWGQTRRILTPGFAQAAMHRYHNTMQSVADDLTAEWAAGSGVVDVHSAMTRATVEVIARAGFSRDLGLFHARLTSTESKKFVDAIARILVWAAESTNDLPILGVIRQALRARSVKRDTAYIRRFVDEIIAERTTSPTDDTDLLNLMLGTVDSETGEKLSAETVRNQVVTFLVAGHETTAALLEVALHYVANDSELQERILADVHERDSFDYRAVAGMRLTRQVLNECLRLWPPAPGYFRVARSEQFLDGYRVPQGKSVFVLALAAQRDPTAWGPTAEQFDPERFDAGQMRQFPDRFFQPFGVGPRSCIGRAFALHEATLLLARIVAGFTLNGDGAPIDMRERSSIRPVRYRLKVVRRQ